MKQHYTLPLLLACIAGTANAQLSVLPQSYWASAVNNEGLVAGYLAGAPTYMLWNPDFSTTEDIEGVSPAGGAGGQAKFAADGQRLSGGAMGATASEMAYFDRNNGEWIALGGLGGVSDGNASSAWGISGDGTTVVGLAWMSAGGAHAVAYNGSEGLMDLGSLFPESSTRANAVNADGTVVVGWQDQNGPWKAAVWRKDPSGGYLPNTPILIDPTGSGTDENNLAGECSAISADGSVIGGYGDFANNDEPWIWSEADGFVSLGALPNMGTGYVSAISADGSVVVGWFNGPFFGAPRKAFIWSAGGGLQDLNTYASNTLGIPLGNTVLYTASDISPDGRYITGTGVNSSTLAMLAYRLKLPGTTVVQAQHEALPIPLWPNPTQDLVRIRVPQPSTLSIVASDGRVLHHGPAQGDTTLDLSPFADGVYTVVVRTETAQHTMRVVKH